MKKVLVNVSDNGVITLFDGTIIAKLNPDIKYAALPEYEGKDLHRYAKLKGLFLTFDGIEHQQYKERYTFKQNNETAVVDFEYKKNGFFGRVVPIQNMTNSQSLLSSIQTALQTFKQEEYAS